MVSAKRGISTGKSVDKAEEWLLKQFKQKETWAAAWTWGHPSLGVHSTQRAESTLVTCGSLLLLLKQLLSAVAKKEKEQTITAIRITLGTTSLETYDPRVLIGVKPLVSRWAFDLMKGQVAQAANYHAHETDTEGTYKVSMLPDVVLLQM